MRKFFEDLYYGRYRPSERKVWRSPQKEEIAEKIDKETSYFSTLLTADDYRRFMEMEDLYFSLCGYDTISAFAYGVRYGARFMEAVLTDDGPDK